MVQYLLVSNTNSILTGFKKFQNFPDFCKSEWRVQRTRGQWDRSNSRIVNSAVITVRGGRSAGGCNLAGNGGGEPTQIYPQRCNAYTQSTGATSVSVGFSAVVK